jgi:hypothetical protein
MNRYVGILVRQSLKDPEDITGLPTVCNKTIGAWDFLCLSIQPSELDGHLKYVQENMVTHDCWYAHYFRDDHLIVVYRDRVFHATMNPETWHLAIQYGRDHGSPMEPLDIMPCNQRDASVFFGISVVAS